MRGENLKNRRDNKSMILNKLPRKVQSTKRENCLKENPQAQVEDLHCQEAHQT